MNNKTLSIKIAEDVSKKGGNVYYVGGYVRDELLNKENKDIDIEVYGITPSELKNICKKYGKIDEVGVSFGVLKIHGFNLDITMPRTERAIGNTHKDFEIDVNPYMSTYEAAKRRDFTINALMKHVLTGEIIDHFNGLEDLNNKIIKHIDNKTFIEDPLRVFRAAGFASRLNFSISNDTVKLCKEIDVSTLSKERVYEETNKVLLKADNPSIYFEYLSKMNKLDKFFPSIKCLHGIKQDPTYHPEGDVWIHTMQVIDNASKLKEYSSYPLGFMYSALFHDVGKSITSIYDEKKQRITAINHDIESKKIIEKDLLLLTNDKFLMKYVSNMVENHMGPYNLKENSKSSSFNRLFDKVQNPDDLIYLHYSDKMGRKEITEKELNMWNEKIDHYKELIKEPQVTGNDLIAMGYIPCPDFSKLLNTLHNIFLADIPKEKIIKQIPSLIKQCKFNIKKMEREEFEK